MPRRKRRRAPLLRLSLLLIAVLILVGLKASGARALAFQVDFVQSTYQTQTGDTFDDLLLQHQAGSLIQSTVTNGLENISTNVYAAGVNSDYSVLMTAVLDVGIAGIYEFQVGTDWGRGGATVLIDNADGSILSERTITDDIWWAYDWNNSDVFTTSFAFQPGDSYTLMWVGFEGCCGGSSTIRFQVDGGGFQPVTVPNLTPYVTSPVPEPGTALLMGMGLAGLATGRRRYVATR